MERQAKIISLTQIKTSTNVRFVLEGRRREVMGIIVMEAISNVPYRNKIRRKDIAGVSNIVRKVSIMRGIERERERRLFTL